MNFILETHCLIDAVNAQEYDRGKNKTILFFHLISFYLVLDLLQSGVDPRTADKYDRTPLHVACTKLDAAIGKS